jgi:predicted DNA binding CopG/RHH family protein
MNKPKKPNLKQALKNIDKSPKEYFGDVDIDLSTLPCFARPKKEKITANFDSDLLGAIRELAKKNKVSYTTLMNDVLRRVFLRKT